MNQLLTIPQSAPTLTVADLLHQLGDIPPERVWLQPAPGTATEEDVTEIERRYNRLCELVDGVLVEKTMGQFESRVAFVLGHFLEEFLTGHDLGIAYGADATLRLMPRLVRIPDVSFVSWKRLPGRKIPNAPIADLVPDLAVEVLSRGNRPREMARKLKEYFQSGVRLVWLIDPPARTVRIYTSPRKFTEIDETQTLTGGKVLPGFTLSLKTFFARVEGKPGKTS